MFTDAKENLRIISYFRGSVRALGAAEGAEAVGARPSQINRAAWGDHSVKCRGVTDLQGPPSERTPEQKLWDFKTRAQQYARDRESCDDVRISYLEFLETEAEDDLALARMIAG
jgi:hypothetical protein